MQESGQIRHLENKFSIASYELIKACTPEELKFYLWLKLWAINKSSAWPGMAVISSDLGMEKRNVMRMIGRIEKLGRLKILREARQNNIYDITTYDIINQWGSTKKGTRVVPKVSLGVVPKVSPQRIEINEKKKTNGSFKEQGFKKLTYEEVMSQIK